MHSKTSVKQGEGNINTLGKFQYETKLLIFLNTGIFIILLITGEFL